VAPAPVFLGYPRPVGRAGVRNHLLVLSVNGLVSPAARRVAAALPGSRLVATPYGRGQFGADKKAHERLIAGLAGNPNVGAVLVLGADRETVEQFAASAASAGKPVEAISLDEVHEDTLTLSDRGLRDGAHLGHAISRLRRAPVPASELFLGVECGHSDATSGLVSNPLVGAIADQLVDAGGTVVFGETLEWLGAEHVLAARAANPAVGEAIRNTVLQRERAVAATGMDLLGNNPGQENIRGGLSTIEEKSLGAIAKGGSRPVQSLLGLGEAPAGPGLHVMDGPGFSPESLTGFAAAGAQLMLFTTGAGNSFCSALAPTLKVSAHPEAVRRLPEQIDLDASAVLLGRERLEECAARAFDLLLETASGSASWGEILDETAEVFARLGPSY
jgi:altronate dehydratase large subunit